jgi:hypothetical protein
MCNWDTEWSPHGGQNASERKSVSLQSAEHVNKMTAKQALWLAHFVAGVTDKCVEGRLGEMRQREEKCEFAVSAKQTRWLQQAPVLSGLTEDSRVAIRLLLTRLRRCKLGKV